MIGLVCGFLSRNFQFFITPHLMVAFKIKYWKKLRILTEQGGGGVKASPELSYVKKFISKVQSISLIETGVCEACLNFFV